MTGTGTARGVVRWLARWSLAGLLAVGVAQAAAAQAQTRAAPVTGPGVVTIGNIGVGSRVNLRSGPGSEFSSVGNLGYGTRVEVGPCVNPGQGLWCQVQSVDGRASGFVDDRFLVRGGRPPAGSGDGLDGGPDYWAVAGLSRGDVLNVRRDPSAKAPALATLREGEVVRNLGCRTNDGARWCRIRSTTGMDVTGWVAGRYLREAAGPSAGAKPGAGVKPGAKSRGRYVVSGLPAGDTLNIRAEPSGTARIIATLQPGEKVERFGCKDVGRFRWCQIRTLGRSDLTGWVNSRYLTKG